MCKIPRGSPLKEGDWYELWLVIISKMHLKNKAVGFCHGRYGCLYTTHNHLQPDGRVGEWPSHMHISDLDQVWAPLPFTSTRTRHISPPDSRGTIGVRGPWDLRRRTEITPVTDSHTWEAILGSKNANWDDYTIVVDKIHHSTCIHFTAPPKFHYFNTKNVLCPKILLFWTRFPSGPLGRSS